MLFPLFDRNPHSRFPWIVLLLIVANVFCFWQSTQGGRDSYLKTVYLWGFVPARLTQVDSVEPIVIKQVVEAENQQLEFRAELSTTPQAVYPTLVSMMFLHGGWLHLLMNMWMLWVFGDNVEDQLGRVVFVGFYLVGGLVAVLAQWVHDPESVQPVIGASGAVAAVLGGYMVTFPSAKVKTFIFIGIPLLLDLPAYLVLGAWFVLQMVAGVAGLMQPEDVNISIAFWAHIGGFIAGAVLMPLLTLGAAPPDEDWRSESKEMFEF